MPAAKTKYSSKEVLDALRSQVSNLAQAMVSLETIVITLQEQAIKQHENIVSLSDQLDALKQPETN